MIRIMILPTYRRMKSILGKKPPLKTTEAKSLNEELKHCARYTPLHPEPKKHPGASVRAWRARHTDAKVSLDTTECTIAARTVAGELMSREVMRKTSRAASAASRLRSVSSPSITGYGRVMRSKPAFDDPGFVVV